MSKKVFLAILSITLGLNIFAQAPGCPNISVSSNDTLDCNKNCVRLGSEVLRTGQTTSYTVGSVPYAPPFPFSGGTALFVGQDDIWSGIINLPFTFCFYGNSYNKLVVGANGVLSFNTSLATLTCPWSFSASVPSSSLITNAIFGAYHDIDPSIATTGNINYAVIGSSPCRTFVVNYNNIKQFSCTSIATTQQIVLYEATNVVEVYILNKPTCSTWNSGNALIGLQNSTGTAGITPPGRNTGSWTASNEAWRFTPSGAPNYVVNWYEGSSLIGTGDSITVCPSSTRNYTAEVVYTNCNGNLILDSGDVTVYVADSIMVVDASHDVSICIGDTVILGGSPTAYGGSGTYTYTWSPSDGLNDSTISNPIVVPNITQTYYLTVDDGVQCIITDSVKIIVNNYPIVNAGPDDTLTCVNLVLGLNGTSSIPATYSWNTSGGNIVSGASTTTPQVDQTGLYIFEVNNFGCKGSDTLEIFQDATLPIVDAGTDTSLTCAADTIQLSGSATGTNIVYYWTGPSILSGDSTFTPIVTGPGSYVLTAIDTVNFCQISSTINVVDLRNPPNVFAGNTAAITCTIPSLNLNGTGSDTGTNIGYEWTTSNGSILSGVDSIIATTNTPGNYVLTVYDTITGCSASDNVIITLNNTLPTASAGADTSLNCATILTGVPLDGSGSSSPAPTYTYLWTTPTGNIVAGSTANFALVNAPGTYTLTVTNSTNGCVNFDNTIVVIDTIKPTANAGSDMIRNCYNPTVNLNGTGSSSGSNITYQWVGSSITSGANSTTPTVSGTGNYTLTVTNTSNECTSTDIAVVTSNFTPPGANAGVLDSLCSGDDLILNGATTSGDFTVWTTSTGNIVSGDSTLTPTIDAGGTYLLTTTNTVNGCQSTSSVFIHETFVSAIIVADPISGQVPLTVNFMNNGIADSSYWNFANGQTFGDTSAISSSSIVYDTQGSYVVMLTSYNGQCSKTTQITIEVIGTSILIVPNVFTPNGDASNPVFEFIYQNITEFNCVLFNRWGKQIAEITAVDKSWDGKISGTDASDGTYFYIIKAKGMDDVEYNLKGTVTLIR